MFKKKIKSYKQLSTKISVKENEDNLIFFSTLLNKVEYFIFFGTLLGITRDKKLINGDDDIDFYVNIKDRTTLVNTLKKNHIEVDLNLSVNKNKFFLQVTRFINNKYLIADFYFYETEIEKNHIIERWNFEGGTQDKTKHLRIPKIFIYPLKTRKFRSTNIIMPQSEELLCEYLYGRFWKKKMKKDHEYEIKVINGKPQLYIVKKFFFLKKLIPLT